MNNLSPGTMMKAFGFIFALVVFVAVAMPLTGDANDGRFLLRDGSRAMQGDLEMGGNDITGTGTLTIVDMAASGDATVGGDLAVTGDIAAAGGFKVVYPFAAANIAASQTKLGTYHMLGGGDLNQAVMPYDGSIVGLGIYCSEARTNGTGTFEVYKNGSTAMGFSVVINGTSTQYTSATQPKDTDVFVAGDRITIKLTTDASWAPTTNDCIVDVTVEY